MIPSDSQNHKEEWNDSLAAIEYQAPRQTKQIHQKIRESALDKISSRRTSYERYKSLPPYPSIVRGRFDPEEWAADPHRRSDVYDEQKIHSANTESKS